MASLPVAIQPIEQMSEQQQLEMVLRISREQSRNSSGLNLADEGLYRRTMDDDEEIFSDEDGEYQYNHSRHVMSEEERIRRENNRLELLHRGLEELDGDSPQARKPKLITSPLSPHQLAGLYDMQRREKGEIQFKIGIIMNAVLNSNVGILGDKPGHGKTRIVLSLIASDYDNKGKIKERRTSFFYSKDIGNVGSLTISEPLNLDKPKKEGSSNGKDKKQKGRKPLASSDSEEDSEEDSAKDSDGDSSSSSSSSSSPAPKRKKDPVIGDFDEDDIDMDGYFNERTKQIVFGDRKRLDMTLIVLPAKLVNLWISEIEKHTKLKYHSLKPREKPDFVKLQKNKTQIILCNISTWRLCIGYRWRRIVIDEADTIKTVGTDLDYEFLWFITGSYDDLIKRTTQLPGNLLKQIKKDREYYNHLVTKSSDEFIEESRLTPPYNEYTVTCKGVRAIKHVKQLMGKEIAEMVSSGDIKSAVLALGGKEGENENLLDLVTNKLKMKLENLETTRKYIETLRYDNEDQRKERLMRNELEIKTINAQIKQAENAIAEIKGDEFICTICYEPVDKVTILPCTHGFCGPCILGWFQEKHNNICPMCRASISLKDLVVVDRKDLKDCEDCTEKKICKKCRNKKKEKKEKQNNKNKQKKKETRTKADALLEICTSLDKVLVFTRNQGGFEKLKMTLKDCGKRVDEYINNRTTVLQAFRDGKVDVLILDPATTAGIPLKEANVVVMYHIMDDGLDRQAIGRAQRPGRDGELCVFRLVYEYEDEHEQE